MNETHPILCGECRVAIVRVEKGGETWGVCPACGREDRMDDIVRETENYRLDKSIKGELAGVQSGSMSVESPLQGPFRWITGH